MQLQSWSVKSTIYLYMSSGSDLTSTIMIFYDCDMSGAAQGGRDGEMDP